MSLLSAPLAVRRAAMGLLLTGFAAAGAAAPAVADDGLVVVSSGGFAEAFKALSPIYETQAGAVPVKQVFGPSMGDTAGAIPARLARGEAIDVVVMVEPALDHLMADGWLVPGSKRRLALSRIACAVPSGEPTVPLDDVAQVKQAFLQAPSVAWSDSASGQYIQGELLARLGIEADVKAKGRQIPATPVGEILARHEAAFGCQQRSELQPVRGIDIVGDLPAELQRVTPYAAARVARSRRPQAAERYLDFLTGRDSAPAIRAAGLEPVVR
ncbi:substrate-binding domain-containing protein [Roseateles cellulosilyticus]|uniref:Substrate-binding domain-containing protein n=1 Tax=Pelomonas cellulosilytica TaxID=2906762 RepID=A0ABS8XXE8_9BURK|nr:substrate-binding domain-containing protein [Pelomonas sp. P8]MCE4555276.1 substrate-binding domain-containing protein [Pelomonas sp. P8]